MSLSWSTSSPPSGNVRAGRPDDRRRRAPRAGRQANRSPTLCGVSPRRFVLLAATALPAAATFAAGAGPAVAHRAPFKCPRGGLAGSTCVAAGAPCNAGSRALYAQRGLVCAHASLRRGGLAVQREGGAFAVEASGHVGLAEAEQAFIAIYRPLPGVKRVPGAVALPPGADVTGPRLWIRHYLPRLTPVQRRVVERVLATAHLAHAAKKKNTLLNELEPILIARIEQETGIKYRFKPVVYTGNAAELGKSSKGVPSGGYAEPLTGADHETITGCEVLVLESEASEYANAVRVLGHELTHCAQESVAGTIARFYSLPEYFIEGYALWAGDKLQEQIAGQTFNDPGLVAWVNDPFKDLYTRDYDGGGIYDEVADETGQGGYPWAILQPLIAAHSAAGIYSFLKSVGGADFEANLATNALLTPTLGQQWTFDGPGITPATEQAELRKINLDNGASTTLGAPPRAADRAEVDLEADIVTIAGSAPGGLHLSDGRTLAVTQTRLCDLQEGCRCPNGDNPAEEGGQKGPAVIAFWGEQSGNKVTLTGESLAEACKEQAVNPPGGGGASGTGVTLKKLSGATVADFSEAASCTLSGATVSARLSATSGGGSMIVKLTPVQAGHKAEFQFHDPAEGGSTAHYGSYETDTPLARSEEEGPALAGDASYNGAQRFFIDTALFLPGAGDGAFAAGFFTCPKSTL